MDEFNREFDPTNEYMSLDDESSNTDVTLNNTDDVDTAQDLQEPVQVETVEDDVFEAFEKATNTPSPYKNPIPQPTPQPYTEPVSYPA